MIAVPTDTIYGVACLAQSNNAVEMLYEIKHRHREKAIAICVGAVDDIKRLEGLDAIIIDLCIKCYYLERPWTYI